MLWEVFECVGLGTSRRRDGGAETESESDDGVLLRFLCVE